MGSLKESTLEKLLEMGGDKAQRRRFLLDASQGITVEAVIDLVKAASAAEGQTVSHSMLRMLSKLAHHPSSGSGPRAKTDPTVRDVMNVSSMNGVSKTRTRSVTAGVQNSEPPRGRRNLLRQWHRNRMRAGANDSDRHRDQRNGKQIHSA